MPSKNISAKKILSDHRQNILGNRLSLSDNDESNNACKSKETPTAKNGSPKPGTSKGQLISKGLFGGTVSTKKPMIFL